MIEMNTTKINYMGMLISFKTILFRLILINYYYFSFFITTFLLLSDTGTHRVRSDPREQSVNSAKAKFLAYLAVFPDRRQK